MTDKSPEQPTITPIADNNIEKLEFQLPPEPKIQQSGSIRQQARLLYQEAGREFLKAHYDKSQDLLTKAVEQFPNSVESHLLLAKVFLQKSIGGRDPVLMEAAKQQLEIAAGLESDNLEIKELLELFNYDN